MAQEYVPESARESLVDIRDVKLDSSMEQADRVRSFIQQVKNPYRFKVGDVVVNVAYTNGGATLNESVRSTPPRLQKQCRGFGTLHCMEGFLCWTTGKRMETR